MWAAMTSAKNRNLTCEQVADEPSTASSELAADQLLYTREQLRRILGGISTDTVIRLEAAGRLKPVRLTPGKLGRVYYRRRDVEALIEAE